MSKYDHAENQTPPLRTWKHRFASHKKKCTPAHGPQQTPRKRTTQENSCGETRHIHPKNKNKNINRYQHTLDKTSPHYISQRVPCLPPRQKKTTTACAEQRKKRTRGLETPPRRHFPAQNKYIKQTDPSCPRVPTRSHIIRKPSTQPQVHVYVS